MPIVARYNGNYGSHGGIFLLPTISIQASSSTIKIICLVDTPPLPKCIKGEDLDIKTNHLARMRTDILVT